MMVAVAGCGSHASHPSPAATAVAASPPPSPVAATEFPDTPAGRQARWLFGAAVHPPIPTPKVTDHFDAAFLAQVSPAHLNKALLPLRTLQLDSITSSTPNTLNVIATANGKSRFTVNLTVDARGLISSFVFQPVGVPAPVASPPPMPTSWDAVDRDFRSVAPQVRFLVASVSGNTCTPIQSLDPTAAAPLASSFKLYVLDALAKAIAAGKVSWSQQLTITSQIKSIPSGILQAEPDGTRVSVQQAASDMISISDNTATDMLISLLGRDAIEEAMRTSGMADPVRDVPLLTTRELFVLESDDWPALADRYLALDTAGRLALLSGTVDHVSLSALKSTAWTAPRSTINALEWFASPTDICHVYASLATLARQPKLAPLAAILNLPGAMGLNPSQWSSVWFKGGSEPGVLTANYLAVSRSGQTYVVSVLAENPSAPISLSATQTLSRAVQGAIQLASPGAH